MSETVRLTVAQAVVRFLGRQRSERDGQVRPLFAGCLGIFGHGNVAGIGQALLQEERAVGETPGGITFGTGWSSFALLVGSALLKSSTAFSTKSARSLSSASCNLLQDLSKLLS